MRGRPGVTEGGFFIAHFHCPGLKSGAMEMGNDFQYRGKECINQPI